MKLINLLKALCFFIFIMGAALQPLFLFAEPSENTSNPAGKTSSDEEGEPIYIYKGGQFRDPFVPLVGHTLSEFSGVKAEAGAFNPTSVELKGIVKTKTGRWAILRGASSENYTVQNGKIRDAKKKPVEGYVGIVKEQSIVVIGPNNQVTELKIRKESDRNSR